MQLDVVWMDFSNRASKVKLNQGESRYIQADLDVHGFKTFYFVYESYF